uniref:Uncharacterized protein n=1 Tax=Tanacetum cinerariifolium TaxID=118510 RepID=A0A699I7B9_TANCI|nr:hypothetical protein [Tanacetum cinerariifolium]
MHQFWDSIYKHDTFYRFKIDKRKRFKLTLEIFKDIFKICPCVQGQDFDALFTDEEIVSFLRELRHTREINSLNDVVVDHMHQPWRTFVALINKCLSKKTIGLDKLRLSREQILWELHLLRKHKSLRNQPLLNSLVSQFQLAHTEKSKRVKRPAKKSTETPARGVIRETLEMPLTKKKEKVDVTRGKGIELLSQVALTEDAQFEEIQKKSMRDFHMTHPSGSGTVTKTAPSVVKIKPSATSKRTSVKPGVPDVAKEESSKSEAESWGNDEDDSNNEQVSKSDKSKENEEDDDEDKTKIFDKAEGDEDEEIDYTTSQLYDDVDIRLNEPVDTDKRFDQEEGIDAAKTNVQQGNENPEISQVIKDAHVTLFAVPHKTKVPVTSSSHSSDLAAKFLNFLDIPHTYAEIVSLLDVHVHHEVPNEHLDARLGATKDEFMNFLSASITARITEQVKNQLPQILPKEVSNFAPLVIQSMFTESLEQAVLAKESSQLQSFYEATTMLTEFELKKILINKIDKSESYLAAPEHRECYEGLKKSYDLDKTFFSTYGKVYSLKRSRKDKDKDEDPSAGSD